MKVGDCVFSEKWNVQGVIQEIFPCHVIDCEKLVINLDPENKGVRGHYHAENFAVIEEN